MALAQSAVANLLPSPDYTVWWYDPRSGKSVRAGTVDRKPVLHFTAPSRGPGFDWVLILDEQGRNFLPPGTEKK